MTEQGFTLDVRSNVDLLLRRLGEFRNESLPFWTAYALTKTAQDIQVREVEVMAEVFDRPTRFTLNSLYVKPATKRDLRAFVMFKEGFGSVPAWRYLGAQIMGGPRDKKGHERALERAGIMSDDEFCVPGKGVKLDAYGNVSGPLITRILSSLGANPDPMSNTTERSKRRNPRRTNFFVLRGHGRAPDGIYERKGRGVLVPTLIFVRQPRYDKRFPFYETADQVFKQRFAVNFREAVMRYPHRPASVRHRA
jgi:hypothetical protein